jgi:hypothetical protein
MDPCSKRKIYNPDSGRCVLRSGNIGKKILRSRSLEKNKSRKSFLSSIT